MRTATRASPVGAAVRLRVIAEPMPHLRSVALGVWVGVGSVDEPESLAGATHYLEHWLFRRTRKRHRRRRSTSSIDGAGGLLNAFTSKEFTCYYARALDDDLDLALDVLGDIVTEPSLTSADFEAERQVIGEELAMAGDDPADAVHELFAEALFGEHPLARPILGTEESVDLAQPQPGRRLVPPSLHPAADRGDRRRQRRPRARRRPGPQASGQSARAARRRRTGAAPSGQPRTGSRPAPKGSLR